MREHEQRQVADAEPAELLRDVGLRWAWSTSGALWHLEQTRVALADVEERDPEPEGGGMTGSRAARHAIATSATPAARIDTVRDCRARTIAPASPTPTAGTGKRRELRVRPADTARAQNTR